MPRPRVLLLVYGASLLLTALTICGLALLVSQHVTASAIRSAVSADQSVVRGFLAQALPGGGLGAVAANPARAADASAKLASLVDGQGVLLARAVARDGTVIVSDRASERGLRVPMDERLRAAVEGRSSAEIVTSPALGWPAGRPVVVEYWPIMADGTVQAVFELRRDAAPILADADAIRRDVVVVAASAALTLALLLYLIFRGAQTRLTRQTNELVESGRRDALTRLLNHGAIVRVLEEQLEAAREDGSAVGIALVDVDNFRLLNDVHGHAAGDVVLRSVVEALEIDSSSWSSIGRYGPDEFLVISRPGGARELEPAIRRLRERLESVSVKFGNSERLPVTVSVGIAHFPFHANALTELLTAATIALGEAKASGGDAIRVAGAWVEDPGTERTSFDILQGLVVAVDTKDRYTKRHSEDVARYALFLADQLEVDGTLRETLRVAGLLHDVGKIGIPDEILRKPGKLTPYEYEIVKQHVALGDLIVRDLPNLWLVRAGIRHHHERWDGTGYLERLAGEKIPLIARILSVADAFSAMTTSRPYRKALTVEEALKRLQDAAGTQLDPTLVTAFVKGIETAPEPPLPGASGAGSTLWTPARNVVTRVA